MKNTIVLILLTLLSGISGAALIGIYREYDYEKFIILVFLLACNNISIAVARTITQKNK